MKRTTKQYLDYSNWPTKNTTVWKAAFASGADLFDDGGPGSPSVGSDGLAVAIYVREVSALSFCRT